MRGSVDPPTVYGVGSVRVETESSISVSKFLGPSQRDSSVTTVDVVLSRGTSHRDHF